MGAGRRVVRTTTIVKKKIFREHRCLGCGQVFNYPLTVGGIHSSKSGPNPLAAAENLALNAQTAVAQVPCPTCKMLQPEMVQKMRSDGREEGVASLILGFLVFGAPMMFFGIWPRVMALMLVFFALSSMGNLDLMNLNPNKKVSRKCRLRKRPGCEGSTPIKRWATGLTVLAGVAGLALFIVAWIYPDKTETENLVISPAWVYPGDEVEIALKGHRFFRPFRQIYSQEADCTFEVAGQSIPLELVKGNWKYNRSFQDWEHLRPQTEEDWEHWLGKTPPLLSDDFDNMVAKMVLQVPENCPPDPDGKLSVSWVISYPGISPSDSQIIKREQMEVQVIDLPLRPASQAIWKKLIVFLIPTLGLVGWLSLIFGAILTVPAGNIKGFPSSILLPGDEGYGMGIDIPEEELQHS